MATMYWRNFEQKAFVAVCIIAAIISSLMLLLIIGNVFIMALPSLSLYFIFTPESATPRIGMAIGNAIAGTVVISLIATILATPVSVGTAIYLQRYAQESRAVRMFRYLIEVLSGTPSVVLGIFGLLLIAIYLGPITGGFSLMSGSIALTILIIPVIERSAEDAIQATDKLLEEGSYALGATKWEIVRFITIPAATSGILTGVILGFGRAAEESAVVILTAGYSQFMPEFAVKHSDKLIGGIKVYPLQDVIGTLPYAVYHAYENSNVIPMSNGFAAAFILICIVLCINFSAKFILSRTIAGSTGKSGGSWADQIKSKIFPHKNNPLKMSVPNEGEESIGDLNASTLPSSQKFAEDGAGPLSLRKRITAIFSGINNQKTKPVISPEGESSQNKSPSPKISLRTFLRALIPFVIPALLLLLIAFLSGIPPLHHALGPVNPSLAGLFATGLSFFITVVGLVFGLLLAKKTGVFKEKSRRMGYAGVISGICLVCIAGIICSSAASGIFSTGEKTVTNDKTDRQAKLAALIAESEAAGNGVSAVETTMASSSAPSSTIAVVNSSGGVLIPVKDSLSLAESYQYGDATRICEATVYDYKVLPFYFWWFIDYNRFVVSMPKNKSSYLVVFVRIENIGTNSALVPSAEKIQVTSNGQNYTHKAYFEKSVLSAAQIEYYSSRYNDLPYQWIRELGQDKRDYAFLTGYNIFGGYNFTRTTTNTTVTVTPTSTTTFETRTTSTSSDEATNGKGFFIKPGPGNAIDGYLIFEVPDSVVKKNLSQTYVDIAFKANSGTRWRLEPAG